MKKLLNTNINYLNLFIIVSIATLIIKFVVAFYLPLTGDEACFTVWGSFFDLGYYDHPPLIGWILHVLLYFGSSNLILRLPAIFVTTLVGIGLYLFIRPYDDIKASLIGILYLISPINLLGVLVTTDIPLIFFSFLSCVFLFLALKNDDRLIFYILSGLCLGLAFFSKYFAVLLALSYLIYFVFTKKTFRKTVGFSLVFLGILPFGLINLYWNYTHSWSNVIFNLYTRNVGIKFNWQTIFLYVLLIIYLITPPIFYYFIKYFKKLLKKDYYRDFGIFILSFIFPLSFFLVLSSIKTIGLHWPLSFIPFGYLLLFILLSDQEITRCIKFMIGFTGAHILILIMMLTLPVTFYHEKSEEEYSDIVFILKHPEVRNYLKKYERRFIITSPSYAKAMLMYVDSGIYSPTFGKGSVHGRQDDFITDFKKLTNKDFAILLTKEPKKNDFSSYVKRTDMHSFSLYGAKYYVVLGYDFQYEKYRDKVLRYIYENYWQIPKYLPHASNFYCIKYFEDCD